MAFQVEDVHDAIPRRNSLVRLFDWHGLHQSSRAAWCRPSIAFCNWSASIMGGPKI
jgi:hypothetical protein